MVLPDPWLLGLGWALALGLLEVQQFNWFNCSVSVSGMMLPDSDERVTSYLEVLESKRRLTDDEIVGSMTSGTTWPNCWKKHAAAKEKLGELVGTAVVALSLLSAAGCLLWKNAVGRPLGHGAMNHESISVELP